jgi:hypothetical protein
VIQSKWRWKPFWKIKAPPRCKVTLWLALNNKLLTWDNCLRRGWCGPSRCPLCKENQETIIHIFISCPCVGKVVQLIKDQLKTKANWDQGSLEDYFRTWIQDKTTTLYAGLPGIMIINIWWARNSVVFKDKTVPPKATAATSISQAEEFKTELRTSKQCFIVPPPIDYTIPWGFFDGASQGHSPSC